MTKMFDENESRKRQEEEDEDDGDFSDMLSEMRILLPGAQMLTAFLIILPFNGGFARIVHSEKLLFLATFVLSLTSLVLLSAPAVQHRIMRPLKDRARFKRVATKLMVTGSLTLAIALVLGTDLVISEVFGSKVGIITSSLVALLILVVWWWMPRYLKKHAGV
jgi:Ca2+/Na+ antiporter